MESLAGCPSWVFVGKIDHKMVRAREWTSIAVMIQHHINGMTSQGFHTFNIYYGLAEDDSRRWEFFISYVIPRGRAEIPLDKLGIVGSVSQSKKVHTIEEALSIHQGWFLDRKYMTVVRCCRSKCFVTRLFGTMNGSADIEYALVQRAGMDEDPNVAEAKLQKQLSRCRQWIDPRTVEQQMNAIIRAT